MTALKASRVQDVFTFIDCYSAAAITIMVIFSIKWLIVWFKWSENSEKSQPRSCQKPSEIQLTITEDELNDCWITNWLVNLNFQLWKNTDISQQEQHR